MFDNSTLFISARSPFARRVRVAFYENNVPFSEQVVDVFKPTAELLKVNPLARVPTLVLEFGQILVDSNLILQAFYESFESRFMPQDRATRHQVYHAQSLAVGLSEKIVEYFLETVRAKNYQDPETFSEIEGILLRSLAHFEETLSHSKSGYLVENGGEPTQADFDLGIALDYLKLRHPLAWERRHPRVAALFVQLNERSAFRKTAPPKA